MKKLSLKKVKEAMANDILDREEISSIKGGYNQIACRTSGGHHYSSTAAVMQSWAAFWSTAGYSVNCYKVYYA